MEHEPKYKIGENVWFFIGKTEKEYGKITQITPVNYNFKYTVKAANGDVYTKISEKKITREQ